MESHVRTCLVSAALEVAVRRRRPREVIHHSHQDSQYTSLGLGRRCRQAGVRPSMHTVGDCYDNAMCDALFATLETELLNRHAFADAAGAGLAVFELIEGRYNPHRRHSALGDQSPLKYERDATQGSAITAPGLPERAHDT